MGDINLEYHAECQTLVGQKFRRLIDQESGEIIDVNQITKRIYGQKMFWKLYLLDFLQILGVLDSKQVDVLIYVLERTNSATNTYIGTWSKIEHDLHISHSTVSRVFKKLQDKNFLKKIQNGVWQVSPDIMMRGDDRKRKLLIEYYRDNATDED